MGEDVLPPEPLPPHPILRMAERAAEAVEQFINLMRRDDQRRADRDAVAAQRAHDQALLLGEADAGGGYACLRIEGALRRLVRNNFEAADQADPARLADERMLGQRREALLEVRRLGLNAFENAVAPVNFERLQADRAGHRMA